MNATASSEDRSQIDVTAGFRKSANEVGVAAIPEYVTTALSTLAIASVSSGQPSGRNISEVSVSGITPSLAMSGDKLRVTGPPVCADTLAKAVPERNV